MSNYFLSLYLRINRKPFLKISRYILFLIMQKVDSINDFSKKKSEYYVHCFEFLSCLLNGSVQIILKFQQR